MMVKKFLTESNDALNRVAKYQSQVDSTKRINGIADDPQATLLALKARNKLSNLELYKSNIQTAESYLTEAESSVSALNEVIKSAYENVISAQSGGKTAEDLKVLAEELKNLQAEVLSIGNTSLGSSYIFGGYNYAGSTSATSKTPPFSVENGNLIYNGIDLSKISYKGDFDASITRMTNQLTSKADGTDLRSVALAYVSDYAGYSDSYAKGKAGEMLGSMKTILNAAKGAMDEAEAYGINSGSAQFTTFKTFYDKMKTLTQKLETEYNKDMAGSYILDTAVPSEHRLSDGTIDYSYYKEQGLNVYTQDEVDNLKFNKQSVLDILSGTPDALVNLITGTGSPTPSPMTSAINALSGVVKTPLNATNYTASMKEITDMMVPKADGSDLMSKIASYQANVAGYSGLVAKNKAQEILGSLKSMISSSKTAMELATAYGVDPLSTNYADFEGFYTGLAAAVNGLESEIDNAAFNKNTINNILNVGAGSINSLLSGTAFSSANNGLTSAVTTPAGAINVATEAGKKTTMQIGTTQTVDITLTGLELLGTGDSNIYHILGKAIQVIEEGADSDELGQVLTSIQNAQSDSLTLQTRIGSTRNRLTLISDRYVTSKLNYTQMRSDAEDADMAESIINLTTAQTVYNAALAGGSEIIKTSLIDFLR